MAFRRRPLLNSLTDTVGVPVLFFSIRLFAAEPGPSRNRTGAVGRGIALTRRTIA